MKQQVNYNDLIDSLIPYMNKLDTGMSETMTGFSQMAKGAMKEGKLSKLNKEFIALAISITSRVEGCIGFHVKALVELGASREELMEALAVTVYMGGGTNMMYAAEALRAFDELSLSKC